MCLVSVIIFAFAIKNAEYHPDKKEKKDTEFINKINKYKKR
jgi:hypothetical protein